MLKGEEKANPNRAENRIEYNEILIEDSVQVPFVLVEEYMSIIGQIGHSNR